MRLHPNFTCVGKICLCFTLPWQLKRPKRSLFAPSPFRNFIKSSPFTPPDFGKIKAVAYGVKSPKSRLGGSLELLNYGTLLFQHRENRELQNITDFNLLDGFDVMRSDFTRITYGCYFAELVDSIASEGVSNPEIFDLLRTTYQFLAHADDVPLTCERV